MFTANKEPLSIFFSGEKKYNVPFFQRRYVWTEENWQELWDSILQVVEQHGGDRERFVGMIITKPCPRQKLSDVNQFDLIDGQQRLTTFSLILKALSDQCNEPDDDNMKRNLENCLYFNDDGNTKHIRIKHSRDDFKCYEKIITGNNVDQSHKLGECYNFFKSQIVETLNGDDKITIRMIKDVILNQMQTISVLLQSDDHEQEIFDTLNSLGVKLTVAELLKNYVFNDAEMREFYTEYWENVYETDEKTIDFWDTEITSGRVKRTNLQILLHCFLIIQNDNVDDVKIEKLFMEYKNQLRDKTTDQKVNFLSDLRKYAEIYKTFPSGEDVKNITNNNREKCLFRILHKFLITTPYPLILYFYEQYDDAESRNAFVITLASYFMRRYICKLTAKNYNHVFVDIMRAMKKGKKLEEVLENYSEETNMFPKDEEMKNAFRVSCLNNTHAHEVLYFIALAHASDRRSDAISLRDKYSIEHIMPKQWRQHWNVDNLSEEQSEERDDYLRTMGNLTLATQSLNSSMKNAAWDKKCITLQKYSRLKITTDYLNKPKWNEQEIAERADKLYEYAKEIWPRK